MGFHTIVSRFDIIFPDRKNTFTSLLRRRDTPHYLIIFIGFPVNDRVNIYRTFYFRPTLLFCQVDSHLAAFDHDDSMVLCLGFE